MRKKFLYAMAALSLTLACNIGQKPPTPASIAASPTSASAVPLPTSTPEARGVFQLAVLVDVHSESVTRDQAQVLVDDASRILYELTGFVFSMIDFQEIDAPGSSRHMIGAYLRNSSTPLPNGIILFSFGDNGDAKRYGGYAYRYPGPDDFRNHFVATGAVEQDLYVGVIHFGHRYAQCGYGDSDTPIGNLSIGGECRGQTDIACVQRNGYSMCSDAVDNLYASTLTYFSATTFVHEVMHPFGELGVMDHFGTADCTAMMESGVSDRRYHNDLLDLSEFQYYAGMCPYVFDNFIHAYRP